MKQVKHFLSPFSFFYSIAAGKRLLCCWRRKYTLDKVYRLKLAEGGMKSTKDAAGDIIRELQISRGKFKNNIINDVKKTLKQWLDHE